ncbi:MAG: AP2 domain-containing protein [Lachnospiraceae bacterium]|nr:AP2 domain-containing protein [Lachnospiraceae bacterium]
MPYVKATERVGTTVNGFKILDSKRENGRTYLYIICPYCEEKKWMRVEDVTSGRCVSCGCYNAKYNLKKGKDLTNCEFGRLKAIEATEQRDNINGSVVWKCECSCGNIAYVSASNLIKKAVRSCGCFAAETSSNNGKIAGKNVAENFCVEGTNVKNLTAKIPKNNTSGIKGVTWDSARNKWRAQICFKGRNYHLGRFSEKKEAIAARNEAEKNIFGDFLAWYSETYPEK